MTNGFFLLYNKLRSIRLVVIDELEKGLNNMLSRGGHNFSKLPTYSSFELEYIIIYITRIMVTIKKRAGVIPYSFSSSIALLSSLLSCSFYLLDLRTISSVDILEMT